MIFAAPASFREIALFFTESAISAIFAPIASIVAFTLLRKSTILPQAFFQALETAEETKISKALKEAKNYYNIKVYEYKNLKEGKITIGPFDIEVIYTKGHTNDSVTYYFKEEKIMFTGDFIFKNSIGRTDLGGNTKDMIESINKIKHYDDSIIIYPGHGEYTTLSSEKENNEFFNTLH